MVAICPAADLQKADVCRPPWLRAAPERSSSEQIARYAARNLKNRARRGFLLIATVVYSPHPTQALKHRCLIISLYIFLHLQQIFLIHSLECAAATSLGYMNQQVQGLMYWFVVIFFFVFVVFLPQKYQHLT